MESRQYIPKFESMQPALFKKAMILEPSNVFELVAFRKCAEAGWFKEYSESEYASVEIVYMDAPGKNNTVIQMPYNKSNVEL